MGDFNSMFPNFLAQCLSLKTLLTPIAFLLITGGLIASTIAHHRSGNAQLQAIGKVIVLIMLIVFLPTWGNQIVSIVDELAASAAYGVCCAARRVLAPPSAIVGSVGVISTMVSLADRDAREGVAFRIITSGKRKADGHLHMPISEDAVRAETRRLISLGRDGGYILAPAHAVEGDVPLENMLAFIDEALSQPGFKP